MPCHLAGSAFAQGPCVGRIDSWSQWLPTSNKILWLLLSGASDPPSGISISDRRTRDTPGERRGTFLAGVTNDLLNMEAAVGNNLFNTVKDLYLTKSTASDHIQRLFDKCEREQIKPILYYTGHGEIGTGNWCFADGTISIQEILDMVPAGMYYPMIFSDACYSGHWANFCLKNNIPGFHCLAACPECSKAIDTKGKGGDLTLFMTGKKPRPCTEPIYSEGNRTEFPITTGYDLVEYGDLIGSHITEHDENILICQSFINGYFFGCFATSERHIPRPDVCWAIRNDYDSFFALVKENWNGINGESKQIHSLACDENLGFGVFFMENFGTNQCIVMNLSHIHERWNDGFQITACAARGLTFYIIMTKDTDEYSGTKQTCFIRNTWNETYTAINEKHKAGFTVTGICYSAGLRQYFVVMTMIPRVQSGHYFHDPPKVLNWMAEQYHVGYHPTVIFTDPTLHKTLVVVTKDENISSCTNAFGFKLKRSVISPPWL